MRTGVSTFTLDYGRCPRWLFERMVRLGRVISLAVIGQFGPEEFLRRLADPVWFQSFGTVLAFDWNASGLTTTTMGALKEALRGLEKRIGVFVCGGKGNVSRKTPAEIQFWAKQINLGEKQANQLEYASRAAAKVDSALIQDGFNIYHHNFVFTPAGDWAVIQQGMNEDLVRARRYHWFGQDLSDFVNEPHTGFFSQAILPKVLDLTDRKSLSNREISWQLTHTSRTLYRDLVILERHLNPQQQLKILDLPDYEFRHHPIELVNFSSPRLKKTLNQLVVSRPNNFENMLMQKNVGGKTIRALSLVSEIIYGAQPSYEDPARFSFAFGGKDGTPYPIDRKTYDQSLRIMEEALRQAHLQQKEKDAALKRLEKVQKIN